MTEFSMRPNLKTVISVGIAINAFIRKINSLQKIIIFMQTPLLSNEIQLLKKSTKNAQIMTKSSMISNLKTTESI